MYAHVHCEAPLKKGVSLKVASRRKAAILRMVRLKGASPLSSGFRSWLSGLANWPPSNGHLPTRPNKREIRTPINWR